MLVPTQALSFFFILAVVSGKEAKTRGLLRGGEGNDFPNPFSGQANATQSAGGYGEPFKNDERNMATGRRLNLFPNQRWKDRSNGIVQVPYDFQSGAFTATDQSIIVDAIDRLSAAVKVIKLVPRTSQAAYIQIGKESGGCFSGIGKDWTGKVQKLNLGDGCVRTGIVQHEFLHALGIHHEQNRPDRDNFVTINWDNIEPKHKHNFELAGNSETLGTQYDYASVMHYGRNSFAVDPNVDVIMPIQAGGEMIGQRDGATDGDIIKVRLMYQCLSGPRSFEMYQTNLCTSDCPCWEGANGCNGNDDACQGSLTCSNNQCVAGGDGGSGGGALGDWEFCTTSSQCKNGCCSKQYSDDGQLKCTPLNGGFDANICVNSGGGGGGSSGGSGGGCTDTQGWYDQDGDGCEWYEFNNACAEYGDFPGSSGFETTANEACCVCGGGSLGGGIFLSLHNEELPSSCIDVSFSQPDNRNVIIYYPCNGTPAQKFWIDDNFYIRSALDTNKCLVGSGGETISGTTLMIYDCLANDDRFVFYYYDDATFRPKLNSYVCIGSSRWETHSSLGVPVMQLSDCEASGYQKWYGSRADRRQLQEARNNPSFKDGRALQDDCSDVPNGWYDVYGDNCAWYAQGTNCDEYGSQNKNFGKTANQACCACGGGSAIPSAIPPDAEDMSGSEIMSDARSCFDFVGWYDGVGDGCVWYAQGDNCEYYGSQFGSEMGTANDACCACGGGSSNPPPDSGEFETPGCSNLPSDWKDVDGDGCDFYDVDDNCVLFGDSYAGVGGKTANEACCACGGGSDPNSSSAPNVPIGSDTAVERGFWFFADGDAP